MDVVSSSDQTQLTELQRGHLVLTEILGLEKVQLYHSCQLEQVLLIINEQSALETGAIEMCPVL